VNTPRQAGKAIRPLEPFKDVSTTLMQSVDARAVLELTSWRLLSMTLMRRRNWAVVSRRPEDALGRPGRACRATTREV
jgi:hypothetical protein